MRSWLVEDEDDAAGDEFVGRGVGFQLQQVHGECDVVGAQDEALCEVVHVAQGEAGLTAYGVEVGAIGAVGHERVVVAIDDGDGIREDERVHGHCVGSGDVDGDKALPRAPRGRGAGADGLEGSGRQMEHGLDGGGADVWLEERYAVGDNRHGAQLRLDVDFGGVVVGGQQIACGEVLGGKDSVHGIEGKLTPVVKEVGQMGLPEARLARQERDAERTPPYSAEQFRAKTLMHLGKIHLWKICPQQ